MTKKEILKMTGLSEEEFYRQYPTEESWTESYKKGGWIQKATASIKRRGTEGVCTGSKFGGPTCRPGTKRYNLAKTFRKMAKSRKEEGGYVDMYEEGGDTDTNPLLNIPESQRFAPVSQRTVIYPEGYIQSKLNPGVPLNFMGQPFATGAIEESVSPLDLIGGVKGGANIVKGAVKYLKAAKKYKDLIKQPNYIQIGDELFNMGPHPKAVRRATNQMNKASRQVHKGAQKLVLPNAFKDGGKIPDNVLRSRLESHMSPAEAQDYIDSYAQGGMVDAYQLMGMPTPAMYAMGGDVMMEDYARGGMIKRKDGSYSRRGLWDNIRANRGSGKKPTKEMLEQERKIRAAEKKEYGGMVNMYGMGGITNIGDLSHIISAKNFPNMGYAMGGSIPMYGFGSVVKDIGAGLYGAGEGMLDTLSMGATDQLTDQGYKTLQNLGGSSEAEKRQQDSIRGYGTTAGAITMGILNPFTASSAVRTGAKGLGQGISKGSPDSQLAQSMGTLLPMAGNVAGMVGGQMSVPSVPQAAMGGQVNYPEGYQKNITFARGGMTGPLTEINVEKGELLTDKDGRIVTKYRGGGMVPHPEEGMDERGTVPAQEGMFVITKAQAKNYEKAMNNSDKLYADAIRNNISYDKAKKEAAEEEAAMTAMDKFVAKYGGAVRRMYAKGGMVPKYDPGSWVTGALNINNPAFGNVDMSAFTTPITRFSGSAGFANTPSSLNLDTSPMTMGQYLTGQSGSYMDYRNIPDTGIGYTGKGYKGADTPGGDFSKYAPYAMQGLPIAWNFMQGMKKPTKVPGDLGAMSTALEAPKMSGEAGRRALAREGAAARYAWRQAGAQAGPAALTALTNARMGRIADFEEGLRNAQAQMDYQAAAQRKAYEQFNAQQAMNRYMLQAQADAVPTQYTSAGMGQLGQMGESILNRQLLKQLEG